MTTVLCHGTFDVLHPGHIAHLEEAKRLGDVLVVSITADEYVMKGPGRPFFPLAQRMEMVKALRCVDEVIPSFSYSALESIERIKPAIYAKGKDYEMFSQDPTGKISDEVEAVEALGGRVIFTDTMLGSSSHILNHLVGSGLKDIMGGYTPKVIFDWLDKCQGLQVEVTGEYIRDHYIWVDAKGKSPKGNNIVYQRTKETEYHGGSAAVLRHVREATGHGFLRPVPEQQEVRKIRYIDNGSGARVFSEVVFDPGPLRALEFGMGTSSYPALMIAADYGHGFVLQREKDKFLALTVQANSLSHWFNLLGTYDHADYVVVDEVELRLSCNDPLGPLEPLIKQQFERMGCVYFVCTIGAHGCIIFDGHTFTTVPALVDKVVDNTGAGDAFLAYTAPLACVGAPALVLGLVGNAAGGLQCQVMGNEHPVCLAELKSFIKAVLA